MRAALVEARLALDSVDVPIGAVVVDPGGGVVGWANTGRGRHGGPPGQAELLAIREAAAARGEWRLTGCTLVVTLEPCTMCAGAARLARGDRLRLRASPAQGGRGRAARR